MRLVLFTLVIVGLAVIFSVFPEGLYLKSMKEGTTLACAAYGELAKKGFHVNLPQHCYKE